MSSDGDNEDELLQIALREQAERDLNYHKPAKQQAAKPVQNYVQTPAQRGGDGTPARSLNNSTMAAAQQQKSRSNQLQQVQRKVVEEDDDSEVEILSISSGDEDSSSKDMARFGVRGRAGAGSGGGGRGGRDEDRGWDGGEPDCWKRVDESELARRVREMRETRSVPVIQKIEVAAMAKRGLSSLQSLPRGMEWVDPLGLGIIDHKTFRLMNDSGPVPSLTEKEPLDANAHEKLNYYSEKFNARLFLSRVHYVTSAADLEAGALALKTDLKGRTQAKKQLVKENFDCFVSCKTTIDDIESKLKRIEEDPEGSGTSHLFNCIQGVCSVANRAFDSLFERQAQAEKIRSVQGMLQRFRTLFNLPSAIRGNISKGEYDLAVREYRKAKSIVLPSHVGILKRVLEEVEKVMQEFKGMLYKSMEDPHIELTNLEDIVRLLVELEPQSDPVWHYLSIQNHRIRGLLEKCTLDHEVRMEALYNELREKALSDAKWRQIQDLNQPLDADDSLNFGNSHLGDPQLHGLTGEEVDALRGRYIRRLTAVLIHHVPAFWKVALSVSTGKFAKSSQVSSDSNITTQANKIEEKVADGKYSSHSLDEIAGMICSTLSAYESKVLNTFHDIEESNVLRPSLISSIKEISKACQAFEAKESAPSVAVVALRTLQCEITKIYILRLCLWMQTATEEISKVESWVPVSILERNKSPYTISSLPLAFRSIIVSAMDQIDQMIQSLRNEATKSEDIFVHLQEIQESVRLAFLNCLLDFAGHLERICSELVQHRSSKGSPSFQNGYSHEFQDKSFDPLPGSVIDPHQQLLTVLSTIGYCKDELACELHNKYKYIWLPSRGEDEADSDMQDLIRSFSGLEEKVLAQYTLVKTNLIRTAAVNYLLDDGVQWGGASTVKGVRDATVELMHTLVAVHAAVFAGCKPLLDKTLGILVEGLIDTFLSLFHENKTKDLRALDSNGFCQLMLELEYFETILNPYFTSDARESLKSLQGDLLEKATESITETMETPSHQRRPTRGSDDVLADERQQGMSVSPDDLIALAQQYSSELLQAELERTRINTACFVESIPLDSVPESAKAAYASFRGSMDSSSFRGTLDSPSSSEALNLLGPQVSPGTGVDSLVSNDVLAYSSLFFFLQSL